MTRNFYAVLNLQTIDFNKIMFYNKKVIICMNSEVSYMGFPVKETIGLAGSVIGLLGTVIGKKNGRNSETKKNSSSSRNRSYNSSHSKSKSTYKKTW